MDAVFRKGVFKKEEGGQIKYETTIEIIRYHEDFRPMLKRNRDGTMGPKTDEIITYQENGLLYALRLSGGVSLFDGPNPKLALKKNECWYLLPRETPIPPGIIIAKDLEPFRGLTHYALQPAEDILRKELQRRLALLERYARPL
ncbi:MAG: hypothetical protein HY308_07275 [Gammaproteobacteria bacterium]|nr:hypothetical protein [Gammaproteobacteria bacterium]